MQSVQVLAHFELFNVSSRVIWLEISFIYHGIDWDAQEKRIKALCIMCLHPHLTKPSISFQQRPTFRVDGDLHLLFLEIEVSLILFIITGN